MVIHYCLQMATLSKLSKMLSKPLRHLSNHSNRSGSTDISTQIRLLHFTDLVDILAIFGAYHMLKTILNIVSCLSDVFNAHVLSKLVPFEDSNWLQRYGPWAGMSILLAYIVIKQVRVKNRIFKTARKRQKTASKCLFFTTSFSGPSTSQQHHKCSQQHAQRKGLQDNSAP